jgi:hypothetical protein
MSLRSLRDVAVKADEPPFQDRRHVRMFSIGLERHDEVLLGLCIHFELGGGPLGVNLGRKTESLRSARTPLIWTSSATVRSAPVEPRAVGEPHNDRPASRIRHNATLARGFVMPRASVGEIAHRPRRQRHVRTLAVPATSTFRSV